MPELPEVETTVRQLSPKVVGRKIKDIWTDAPKMIKGKAKEVLNKKIKKIFRRGKNILIELEGDRMILIHQKLTGHLLFGKWKKEKGEWVPEEKGPLEEKINRFLHLIFFLDNGKMVALSDLRKFAKVVFGRKEEILNSKDIKSLGPEALEISFEDFKKRIKSSKKEIKKVLMDQTKIAGIGNIYSDEILFSAKVHPKKKASDLSEKELKKIYLSMKKILKKAIELQGESISDYRTPSGEKGKFDKVRKVYRREGEKCSRCGGKIERIKIGGRSAHFCPSCQKL